MGNESSIPLNQFLVVGKNVYQTFNQIYRYLEEDKLATSFFSYYTGSTVVVQLMCETTSDKKGVIRLLVFRIYQYGFIQFSIEKTENNLLKIINSDELKKHGLRNFNYETKDRSGEVTKTYVVYNGIEDEGCLFVVEEKKKSGVENPYVVTLAHYYAICGKAYFGLKRYDAGLSMIVNIRVVNNEMDFVWMSSHNNSSRVLLPMFQQVLRTVTWKWDTCPHTAAEACRKQLIYMNKHQFRTNTETETEDKEGSHVQLTKQIGSNLLANQGAITGNNNGNIVVKKLFITSNGIRGNWQDITVGEKGQFEVNQRQVAEYPHIMEPRHDKKVEFRNN